MVENRIGEDGRENTEDPGAQSYPSLLPRGGAGVLKVGPRSWHSNRFIFQAKRYRGEARWKENSGMPAEVLENETLTVDCDEKIENASTFDPSNPSNEDTAHPSQSPFVTHARILLRTSF